MNQYILFKKELQSTKLIVYFSSAAGGNIKKHEGEKLLAAYPFNTLYIKDSGRNWYDGVIPGISTSLDTLIEYLQNFISQHEFEEVVFIGSSMGGYAAILCGIHCKVQRVIAFSPQIILNSALPNTPQQQVKYNDLSEHINNNIDTDIHIWFGEEELLDIYHISTIQSAKKVTLFPIKGSPHNVLFHLKQHLSLYDLFDFYFMEEKKVDYTIYNTRFLGEKEIYFQKIHILIETIYITKEYENALKILQEIEKEVAWAAIHYFKGMVYSKLNQHEKAILEFKKALHYQPLYYDCSYQLALSCLEMKDSNLAEQALFHAIKYHPSPTAQLYAQLSYAQRLQEKNKKAKLSAYESLSIDKYNLWAHYQLAFIYENEKKYQKAIKHLKFILNKKPQWKEIREAMIRNYNEQINNLNS